MDYESDSALYAKLPAKSQAKLRRLFNARDRAHAALWAASERRAEARDNRNHLRNLADTQIQKLGDVSIDYSSGRREIEIVSVFGSRAAIKAEAEINNQPVAEAEDRLDHADAACAIASEEFSEHDYLQSVRDWVHTYFLGGGRLDHQPLPAVKLQRGESFREAVERVRQQIAACNNEWSAVEAAPAPLPDLKVEITRQVDRLAAAGQPKIMGRDAFDGPTDLSSILRLKTAGGLMISDVSSPFLCWLHRDEIVARLHAIAEAQDFTDALSDEDRDLAFSRLLDQKLELARAEEAYICAAAAEGATIPRRRDADPRSILQVIEVFEDEVSPKSAHDRPARGSAPVHSEEGA